MVSLGSKLIVLSRGKNRGLVGVTANEDNLIVTYTDNITVYDTSQRKLINSWTVRSGHRLTSPTIFNQIDQEYATVINSNIVKTFSTDFEKGDKFTVKAPIHSIRPSGRHEVVFKNGNVIPLSEVLSDPSSVPVSGPIPSSASLVEHIEAIPSCFLIREEETHHLILTDVTKIRVRCKLSMATCQLVSSSYSGSAGCCVLVTLWSDGSLCQSRITEASLLQERIEMQRFSTVVLPKEPLNHMMASLSDDRVAVINKDDTAVVVDLKYGVTHDRVEETGLSHVIALGHLLVVAGDESVSVCPFTPSPLTLSSVVGKGARPEALLPHHETWGLGKRQKLSKGNDVSLMQTLLTSSDEKTLDGAWRRLWSSKTPSEHHSIAASAFMVSLLERLTGPGQPWHGPLVKKILSSGCISARAYSGLMDGIVSRGKWDVLETFIEDVTDINETEIAQCLCAIMTWDTQLMSPSVEKIINSILDLPFTEDKLVTALRAMSLDNSMRLLSHLGKRLKNADVESAPDIDKILSWICLLLDAHFPQIIVNSSAWKRLVEIQQIASTQVELYNDLSEIDVMLSKMKESMQPKTNTNKFSYKVQVMRL